MTGDVAAHIGERNTGLLAESRDKRLVQIGHSYPGKANEKEKIDQFASLRVWEFFTLWTDLFPRGDGFADNAIYRLGEGGGGLVDRNVEQTNGVGRQSLASARHSDIILLPPNAAKAQTNDLVAAKAGKEPGDNECSAHLNRIGGYWKWDMVEIALFRKIIGSQVKAGPDELGPDIVCDGSWVRANKRKQALGRDHAAHRIEPSRDQLPLLEIAKEDAKDGNASGTRAGRKDLAAALHMSRIDTAPIAAMPLANDGNGFRSQVPGPIRGRSDLWMNLAEPSADVEQEVVALVPVLK